jgi:hypothetical protein
VHRRVEEDGALDEVGVSRGELRDEPSAEAVPDPGGRADAVVRGGLLQVREVRLGRPRRLPR